MKRIGLAGVIGTALLLGACGGASEEPAAPESPAAAETLTPADATETPSTEETPSATETPEPKPSATATTAAAAPAPPASFNQCKVCHSVKKGEHGLGPSLAGVYGTQAGDILGFEFSSAMKESGLVWNEANLDKYLLDPRGVVPGTKMSYAGLKDAAKRKEVIEYLKTL